LYSLFRGNWGDRVNEFVPPTRQEFLEEIPAFLHPRIAEFLFNRETQLPDDLKPSVTVVESPAHTRLSHRRPVVLIEEREAFDELLCEFVVHVQEEVRLEKICNGNG